MPEQVPAPPAPPASPASPASPIDRARQIARLHGLPSDPIEALVGLGTVNHVVVVGSGGDRWVIRWPRESGDDGVFAVEEWCARRAAAVGVPTPRTVLRGILDGVPYGIQEHVAGAPASSSEAVWAALGRYGAAIGDLQPDDDAPEGLFSRFGRDLDHAWRAHLAYNLACLDGQDILLRRGVYSAAEQRLLRDAVTELLDVPMRFGLGHGDLSPRNLVLPDGGAPVLVDWGSAAFGPLYYPDVLAAEQEEPGSGGPTPAAWRAFVDGLGVDPADLASVLPAFRLLQRHDLVRWALDRRPDRVADTLRDLRAVLDRA